MVNRSGGRFEVNYKKKSKSRANQIDIKLTFQTDYVHLRIAHHRHLRTGTGIIFRATAIHRQLPQNDVSS
jgi:hypothetical protein